jgi:hypothetical protein
MTREETEEVIAAMTAAVRAEMVALEERLSTKVYQHMDHMAASLEETARDLQTEILKTVLTTQEGNVARLGGVA